MVKKILVCCLIFISSFSGFAQELTAAELLEKSIAHHDPQGKWKEFNGSFTVVMQRPNGTERVTKITLDFPRQFFKSEVYDNQDSIVKKLDKKKCSLLFNGSERFKAEIEKKYRLNCEHAVKMKNYYTYLYGLPMKLKDPGTLIDPTVTTTTFKGKKALVIKVNYTEEVGKDTWYFYFNPKTYALEAYQFYHDEAQNDGEYILLTGTTLVNGILMPKDRAWYFNKNEEYLGTDRLR